jgi:hypothetical protein
VVIAYRITTTGAGLPNVGTETCMGCRVGRAMFRNLLMLRAFGAMIENPGVAGSTGTRSGGKVYSLLGTGAAGRHLARLRLRTRQMTDAEAEGNP